MAEADHVLFAHVTQREDDEIDLAAAALLIAEVEYPGLDVAHYVSVLDNWGEAALAQKGTGSDAELAALNGYLFEELGFRGNDDDYYDPRNSFLNEVIDRRVGIPITLSIVFMEVGRRLGLELHGISFPGHFLVRLRTPVGDHVIDPYHGGVRLETEELQSRLEQVLGQNAELGPEHLPIASKRQILTRMLNNLRGIYQRAGDTKREIGVLERLQILSPGDARFGEALDALRAKGGPVGSN
jgi:regulator of sirC expression with transglutaminase-like and TPR domain